jgi:mono/diheme cytochrome c family protein
LFTAAVAAVIGAVALIYSGTFDTTANNPHHPAFAWAIHKTMIQSVKVRADPAAPRLDPTPDVLIAGAREYERRCLACHGGPGVPRQHWVSAMLPTPPFLIDASKRWSQPELYEIIHDGVKMTGMPAWGEIESDRQIAEIVAFLDAMSKMNASAFAKLRLAIALPARPSPDLARGDDRGVLEVDTVPPAR